MKIIESNIIGKKSQEACEDGLVMTDDFIAHDPQCIHEFIATKGLVEGNKSFDDRTYVRFVI